MIVGRPEALPREVQPFPVMDQARARELLSFHRGRIERSLAELARNDDDDELSHLDQHPADEATNLYDDELDDYLHLYLHNRGILLTPFHNMALMCPATTTDDVDTHTEVFGAAVELVGG